MKKLILAIFLLAGLLPASAYTDLDSGMRIFLTRDPAGFVDGPNLYAYVKQNPWTSFDPEGLKTEQQYQDDIAKAQAQQDADVKKFQEQYPQAAKDPHAIAAVRATQQARIDSDKAGIQRIEDYVAEFNKINTGPAGNVNGHYQITKSQKDQLDDNNAQFAYLAAYHYSAATAGGAAENAVILAGGELLGAGAKVFAAFAKPAFKAARSSFSIDAKIMGQMEKRGWNTGAIDDVLANPSHVSPATNKATGGAASAYFRADGSYVVRDNATGKIIQISNRNDANWSVDSTITDPPK